MKEDIPPTYILPMPGTDETQELPRGIVLERIAKGELTSTDWIWSPPDQDWKTVAEIPSLQAAVPAPKKSFLGTLGPVGPKQKVEPITAPTLGLPPASKKKKVKPKRRKSEDEDEPSGLGMVMCVLIVALFAVVAINYQYVDRPLAGNLAQTQFVLVPAHAHLGAFFQRDKLIIHVLPTSELTSDNFADFLFTLASSTPPPPFGATEFTVIELTPGWRGQYAFTGDDWQHLAKMKSSTTQDRKDFILEHIDDASGERLVTASSDGATDKDARDQVWLMLMNSFHSTTGPGSGPISSLFHLFTGTAGKVNDLTNQASSLLPKINPGPGTDAAAATKLSDDQARAVLIIKGDVAEGTGFLVQMPSGPSIITNLHVVAGNPNLKFLTSSGEEIKVLGMQGASDRDMALFSIADNHYSYLPLATAIESTVATDDETLVPGNSLGGEVTLATKGKVVAVGPQKVEISNPVFHGNSGGPIIQTKTGTVIGVVTYASKVIINNAIDQSSIESPDSAISGPMRYFGYRIDNVPQWEPYNQAQFLQERQAMLDFLKTTVALDSLLNGKNSKLPNYWTTNDKLKTAFQAFQESRSSPDKGTQLGGLQVFLFTLQNMADDNLAAMSSPAGLYSYDRAIAMKLAASRQQIKDEINNLGDRINSLHP